MKISVDLSRLDSDTRKHYAALIESDVAALIERIKRDFGGYRCDVHGDQLRVTICVGPNDLRGVIAGFRYEGCCVEFEQTVTVLHFHNYERQFYERQFET